MKTCEKCGLINEDNALFCTSCGALLPVDAEVAQEAAEADETAVEEVITEEPAGIMDEEVIDETAEPLEAADEIPQEAAEIPEAVSEPAYEAEPSVPVPAPVPAFTTVSEPAHSGDVPTPKKGEHTVKGRAFGIIGFILNLEALLSCLIPGANFGALIYSVIGLIFCHISKNNTNFKLTKVAKIFGILALIFSIVTILLYCLLSYLAFEALAHDPQVQDFIGRLFTDLFN